MTLENSRSFVLAWETSGSVAEAARKLGIDGPRAIREAASLRRRGVKLKKFKTVYKAEDVEFLNQAVSNIRCV